MEKDNLSKEEAMKKELQMRIAVAKFMQDTLQEMAARKTTHAHAHSDKKDGSAEDNFGATEVRIDNLCMSLEFLSFLGHCLLYVGDGLHREGAHGGAHP